MKLKQKFLMQNIWILVITIIITSLFGFLYNYLLNLLGEHSSIKDLGQAVIITKDDHIIYNGEDIPIIRFKEILMDYSIGNKYYEYEGNKYKISIEDFIEGGSNYKIISLAPIIDNLQDYRSLFTIVFIVFLITFAISSIRLQRQNMKNIINPITDLIKETEKIKLGELETAITDSGYGEIKELGIAIEELRIQLKNAIYYQEKIDGNRKFLISSISHDLKTPVTAIRGYIDGVLDGIADTNEKKTYYLSKAVEKTQMVDIMIEDLLLYSKLDLNQMRFETDLISIEKYMESCIEDNLQEFLRENKNISLENKLSNESFVRIDAEKFKRVIQNIVDNAKRSIERETGELRIVLRETNSSVIIEFNDNGKGIEQKDLPHIFERFYRSDTAREARGSSGLGLAIAKQIVEGLEGRIWAISQEAQGASIIISLKRFKEGK